MIKVGVVGGSGRIGVELLRLLVMHPNVRIQAVTSRRYAGARVEDVFPLFRHHFQAEFVNPEVGHFSKCDVVFFAAPPGVASVMAPLLLERKIKVIDFSSDFQLLNPADWEAVHGRPHPLPALLTETVSALPETHRLQLRKARLASMPSAHATIIHLALLPLLERSWLDPSALMATVIAGSEPNDRVAGRQSATQDAIENIRTTTISSSAYLEIMQAFPERMRPDVQLAVNAVQVPVTRGMQATLAVRLQDVGAEAVQGLYDERYENEPFIDVLGPTATIETRSVQGANMCRVAVQPGQTERSVTIHAVIDNLVKGTAGQALQAMNLMYGIPEAIGLKHLALMP